jgi:2-methylisocitrate lyase-like PEP mutase family enzyme
LPSVIALSPAAFRWAVNSREYSRTGNQVIGGRTPIFNAQQLGELGYGIVLYANAALQGAVAGMQKALTVLRDEKEVQESSGLVTPFAERQRLVGKPDWDALEKRCAAE